MQIDIERAIAIAAFYRDETESRMGTLPADSAGEWVGKRRASLNGRWQTADALEEEFQRIARGEIPLAERPIA